MKVYMSGEKEMKWALKTDLLLAKEALSGVVEFSSNENTSEAIHCVWPSAYYEQYIDLVRIKPIVAVFQGNPIRLFEHTPGFFQFCQEAYCVAQSGEAYKILKEVGLKKVTFIPYIADLKNFYIIADKLSIRKKYQLPTERFIICNFFRDTLGNNLDLFKPEKGPDIFCEILACVERIIGKNKIHVLLGGPRRHWILKRVRELGISYTYIGREVDHDDMKINKLSFEILNELYNASDLLLVTSRSEGAPRAILEATVAGLPVMSSNVGIAADILNPKAIYKGLVEAVEMVIKEVNGGYLKEFTKESYDKVYRNHSIQAVNLKWKAFYDELQITGGDQSANNWRRSLYADILNLRFIRSIKERLMNVKVNRKRGDICIWINETEENLFNEELINMCLKKRFVRIKVNDSTFSGTHLILNDAIDNNLMKSISELKKSKLVLMIRPNMLESKCYFKNLKMIIDISDEIIFMSFMSWLYYYKIGIMQKKTVFIPMCVVEQKNEENFTDCNYILIDKKGEEELEKVLMELSNRGSNISSLNDFDTDWFAYSGKKIIYICTGRAVSDKNIAKCLEFRIPIVYAYSWNDYLYIGSNGVGYSSINEIIEIVDGISKYYKEIRETMYLPKIKSMGDLIISRL